MKIQIKILDKKFYKSSIIDEGLETEELCYTLPSYATSGSAAIDLVCTKNYTIYPDERVMIGTGLAIWIGSDTKDHIKSLAINQWDSLVIEATDYQPISIAGFIIPRSGLGTKGLILANTVGLIDEDYQGELKISAWNSNPAMVENWAWGTDDSHTKNLESIKLKAGDRIAQMYFAPVIKCEWDIVDEFTESTERGEGGFNSTGA